MVVTSPTPRFDVAALRPELDAACDRALSRLAQPGTWWSAEQRVAIALETRAAFSCDLCARRRAALSPRIPGEHDLGSSRGVLPAVAVEAVHRVTTDSGRLSESWLRELVEQGPEAERILEEQYVELIGVLTQVLSVDEQDRVLGRPLRELPEPEPGEPSRRRPSGARPGPGWVSTVAPEDLDPEDADLYDGRARVGNVIRALSLVPDEVRALVALGAEQYVPGERFFDMGFARALDRGQIEWVASRVSALNECFY